MNGIIIWYMLILLKIFCYNMPFSLPWELKCSGRRNVVCSLLVSQGIGIKNKWNITKQNKKHYFLCGAHGIICPDSTLNILVMFILLSSLFLSCFFFLEEFILDRLSEIKLSRQRFMLCFCKSYNISLKQD